MEGALSSRCFLTIPPLSRCVVGWVEWLLLVLGGPLPNPPPPLLTPYLLAAACKLASFVGGTVVALPEPTQSLSEEESTIKSSRSSCRKAGGSPDCDDGGARWETEGIGCSSPFAGGKTDCLDFKTVGFGRGRRIVAEAKAEAPRGAISREEEAVRLAVVTVSVSE